MSRIKPYTTNQESWHTILKNLRIPMNQREYSWELEEIKKIFMIYLKFTKKNMLKKWVLL